MKQIIIDSKNKLLEGLNSYINDPNFLKIIVEKINNLNIKILDVKDFDEKFKEFGGQGFAPAAFCYEGEVYLKNYNLSEHIIIHEMLHAISEHNYEKGAKHGLLVANKEKNYLYGRGFNEGFTEYLASLITNEMFTGYTEDFKLIIELFMQISNYNIEDVLKLYFQKEEWLSDFVINSFDMINKSLPNLVVEYDNKSIYSKNKFNPNNVMIIILNAIENKINGNDYLDTNKISGNLKQLNNYFYHVDFEFDSEVQEKLANVLDIIGTYKPKK